MTNPNTADSNASASNVTAPDNPQVITEPVVDVSQGYPSGGPQSPPQVPAEPTQTTEPKTDSTKATPDEITAANERLKQQNAANEKLIRSLGLDPGSDLAEQLESGVITQEDVINYIANRASVPRQGTIVQNRPQTTNVTPKGPVETAQAAYEAAKAAYNEEVAGGEVTINTNTKYIEAIHALNEARNAAIADEIRQRDAQAASSENLEAVLTVVRSQPGYADLKPEVRKSVDDVNVAMTCQVIERAAQDLGLDPNRLTKRQVTYFASQANKQLGQLANYYIELGRQEVRNSYSLRSGSPAAGGTPRPVPSGGPVITPPVNTPRITLDNMAEVARQFASGSGAVV
jgi:hypothetical protein